MVDTPKNETKSNQTKPENDKDFCQRISTTKNIIE